MRKYICLIGLIITFSCCSERDNLATLSVVTIPEHADNDSTFFNQYELQSMVALESTPNAIIGDIKRLIIKDDYMLILSRHIYKFALDGKFICQIGNPGRGGSEYRQVLDIAIDEGNNNIVVFSDDYKFIYYTIDGNYIRHERLEKKKLVRAMQVVNNDLYLYKDTKEEENEKLIHKYVNGKFVDCGEIEVSEFPSKGRTFGFGIKMVKSKSILFSQNTDNFIYELKDNNPIIRYKINDSKFLKEDQKKEIVKVSKNIGIELFHSQTVVGYSSIRETDYGIFMTNNLSSIIWIEPNNTVHNFRYIKDDRISQASLHYVAHDANDNLVAFVANPTFIINRKMQYPDPEIEAKLQSITEDSNPVLLFYKHK